MPPPRLCYEVIAPSIFREGSRPSGCPRPMRRGWLRRNRLNRTLRHFHRCRRVFCFVPLSPHFYGEVSERRPWVFKREDRPKGAPNSSAAWSRRNTTEAHSQTAKLAGEQRENLGGEDRDPLHDTSSVVSLRSSSCQSPDLVLPRPFPSVLTTRAFDQGRRRWFGTCSCQPVPRGPPSSIKQLHTLGPPRPFALVAHGRRHSVPTL